MDQSEFDKFADEYHDQHARNIGASGESPDFFAEYKVVDVKQKAAREALKVGDILDFGSGIGNSIPFLGRHFPGARVNGVDVSARSIEVSEARFPGAAEYRLIRDRRIPFESESFDLVFTACVFHHIPHDEHRHWLSELRRVTRNGGLIALFEHNPYNPLTVAAVNTCPFDENARLIKARRLAAVFESTGWNAINLNYRIFFPSALKVARPLERFMTWLPLGAQYSLFARKQA